MKLTPLETALLALIGALALWAWVGGLRHPSLRGPLTPSDHTRYAEILDELPADIIGQGQ
jgi:hypothetical protein